MKPGTLIAGAMGGSNERMSALTYMWDPQICACQNIVSTVPFFDGRVIIYD
jgi:hypothetical protein